MSSTIGRGTDMNPLKPITKIDIDFGTPVSLKPPDCEAICRQIQEEYEYVEGDGHFDILDFEVYLFHNSLTEKEWDEYNTLLAKVDAARENYDPDKHDSNSPEALAYFNAEQAREDFFGTHGKHICYSCSYYLQDLEKNRSAICEFEDRDIHVRPYCLACPNFFTGETPQQKKARLESNMYFSRNPQAAANFKRNQRKHSAERFARHLCNFKNGDHTAFILADDQVNGNSTYYEKLYNEFPDIFKKTPFPTFDVFKDAQIHWKTKREVTTTLLTGDDTNA